MSGSRGEFVAALARAQSKFGPIAKSQTADTGKFRYDYADLADIAATVRPVLNAEGIAVVQPTELTDRGTELVTRLLYGDEVLESRFLLPVEKADAQGVGSLLSYHRRYQLCALVGVQPEREDDDGAAAKGIKHDTRRVANDDGEPLATKEQTALFMKLCKGLELDTEQRRGFVAALFDKTSWRHVTKDEAATAITELEGVESGERVLSFDSAGRPMTWPKDTEPFELVAPEVTGA